MGSGVALASRDSELKARVGAHGLPKGERQGTHFKEGSDGRPFDGEMYLKALQRVRGSAVAKPARKVKPSFCFEARKVRVWLWAGCAADAGLGA
jgi:hypothetical protein